MRQSQPNCEQIQLPPRCKNRSFGVPLRFQRARQSDFNLLGLKGAAAAEVHREACEPQGTRGPLGSFRQPRFPKSLNQQLRV